MPSGAVTVRSAAGSTARMTPRDDATLLGHAASGDHDALAELYDRHGRWAYGVAVRIVRDPALAEDAVQEAFLDLWRSAGRFDPAAATVPTWLGVLVHRRAVDAVRREAVRAKPLPSPFETGVDAEDEYLAGAERERVRGALERLPDEQRRLLELAYWGGLSQRQLAEWCGLPLGTVKSRMFTALATLRDLLAEAPAGCCGVDLAASVD